MEQLTLYDMAKQMVANEEAMDTILLNKNILEISKKMNDKYYLLICPDLRQYVFLSLSTSACPEKIRQELFSILVNRGDVLLIDNTNEEKEIWEFWIKDKFDGEIYMYQLTNYTNQTVEV